MNNKPELNVSVKPWDIPIKEFIKTFPMVVCIYNDAILLHEQNLDYGKSEDRKELGKMTYWALNNGYSVETSRWEDG